MNVHEMIENPKRKLNNENVGNADLNVFCSDG